MPDTDFQTVSRRRALFLASGVAAAALLRLDPASAQQQPARSFGYEDVLKRARELAGRPYEAAPKQLPPELEKLTFDQYRNIIFRPEKAMLDAGGGPFRLHLFHPGFLFTKTIVVNVVRDGIAASVPYASAMFDYGGVKLARPLPVDLGFGGLKINYPLNDPRSFDELITFIGSSYFRVLGRGDVYGLSARGATVNNGAPPGGEEFPFFREFWVEMPGANANRVVIYSLMDSESLTGAYRFEVYPGEESVVEVSATIVPRKPIEKLGIGALTSMFYYSELNRATFTDFRPELHDSDGLLIRTGTGEWLWRPLVNPEGPPEISQFWDRDPKGFGLIQRDRNFDHYEDLELGYEARPSYWIEPHGQWGEGRLELFAFKTADETNDNIVLSWVPKAPVEPGKELAFSYRLTCMPDDHGINKGGRVVNTFTAPAAALGAAEGPGEGTQRFLIDFSGGDLPYFLKDPAKVSVVASVSSGELIRSFLMLNPKIQGFRVGLDVRADKGQTVDIRAFLKAGDRALTETWTLPFRRLEPPAPPQPPAPQPEPVAQPAPAAPASPEPPKP
ncbi:glucan biosynthesis protein G [Methylopila sp. M107]|uniref:glucan biosynthesis protein n=1 Tax=Methylopila sp. M107 TaxID=1101190 RepID=UPI000377870A|nr:glucan biosynthesis protein G [Methylopila sp. M107]